MKFARLLLINSIALSSVFAAILNTGQVFQWWTLTSGEIAQVNTLYVAAVMALRQMFSLTGDAVVPPPTDVTHADVESFEKV